MSRDFRAGSHRQALPSCYRQPGSSPNIDNNDISAQTKIDLVQVNNPSLQNKCFSSKLSITPNNIEKTLLSTPVDKPTVLLPFATAVCPLEETIENSPVNFNASAPLVMQRMRDTPSPEHLGIPCGKAIFPPLRGPEPPEYTSDESGGAGNADPPIIRRVPPRRKNANKSIAARAAYWDLRAERGLLSDSAVEDEFPPMQY